MTSVLNILNYFKKKYEIFNLINELQNYVSNYDLSKININENNLDKYYNKKSHKFDIVMFHSQLNESSIIKYKDIDKSFDLQEYNYNEIIKTNIDYLSKSDKVNKIFLFSNHHFEISKSEKINIIDTKIDTKKLMYERVLSMYSFIKSNLFLNNTCIIDTDVFINFDKLKIFNRNFDIALTHRPTRTLMPINEGVILVKKNPNSNVKVFFENYLKIFSIISKSREVKSFYGDDINKWRGGQLSLNVLSKSSESIFKDYEIIEVYKNKVLILPTFHFNFTPTLLKDYTLEYLRNKSIIHYKGSTKKYLKDFKEIYSC